MTAILDTGAAVSLIKTESLKKIPSEYIKKSEKETNVVLRDVSGNLIKNFGLYYIRFNIAIRPVTGPFIAVDDLNFEGDMILGSDILKTNGIVLDFETNYARYAGIAVPFNYTHKTDIQVIRSQREITKYTLKVRMDKEVILQKNSSTIVTCTVRKTPTENVILRPKNEIYRDLFDMGLSKTNEHSRVRLRLNNHKNEPRILRKNEVIGYAEITDVAEYTKAAIMTIQNDQHKATNVSEEDIRNELSPFVECDDEHRESLLKLLAEFRDVLALPGESLGRTDLISLSLKLQEGIKPISLTPYKIPHSQEAILDDEIERLLDEGIIQATISPWAFPVVLVVKADKSVRLCVDYRKLNAVTESDDYPLPNINDLLMNLGKSEYFSQIDLLQAFHQVPLAEETKPLTAFKTSRGHYQYNVCPFGLKQMPACFQRLMNNIFHQNPKSQHVNAYLDDVLVNSPSKSTHLEHLRDVLQKLQKAKLKIKLKKCKFFTRKVKFLGFDVTSEGFSPQMDKVEAINKFPTPTSVEKIQAFLGMAGYYRCYVKNFSKIASPLTNLLRKGAEFQWTPECETAFTTLKGELSSEPILQYPNYKKEFFLETDASNVGLGCVLSQKDDQTRKLRPISYASRVLNKAERNCSTTEKEALAIVWGLKKI